MLYSPASPGLRQEGCLSTGEAVISQTEGAADRLCCRVARRFARAARLAIRSTSRTLLSLLDFSEQEYFSR